MREMSDYKLPSVGDHVYHICNYNVGNAALHEKGLDGFRNYGIEVVEGKVERNLTDPEMNTVMTIVEKRNLSKGESDIYFWEVEDFGKKVFTSREEAAKYADKRAYDMDHAYGNKFDQKPMYKNWKHWGLNLPPVTKVNKITKPTTARKSRKGFRRKPLPDNFDAVYEKWRDGDYTNAQAAKLLNMPQSTFSEATKAELKKRGEKHSLKNVGQRKELPEGFNDVYEDWESGEISAAEAARKLGMEYTTFLYRAKALFTKRQKEGII